MIQLENFFLNQFQKYQNDDNHFLIYINIFKSYSESSQPLQTRKSSFLGYSCLINAIKKENKDKNSKIILHSELINKIMEKFKIYFKR